MSIDVTVIIPSLDPDDRLRQVVTGLLPLGFSRIILVDDGSREENKRIFSELSSLPGVVLLTHERNFGKGQALKTAFGYCIEHPDGSRGVVTVDGDNQHHPDDVMAVSKALLDDPGAVVLGVRNFDGPDVPARSRTGNRTTSRAFRALYGLEISDTQTGLRAIPFELLPQMCEIPGERFEYETNMLLAVKGMGSHITEVPIRTIYIDENSSSHYRPVADSLRIVFQMLRFAASSGGAALVDYGLYTLLYFLLAAQTLAVRVYIATAAARVVSSAVNYLVNRNAVFRQKSRKPGSLTRYYLLAVCQLAASATLVYLLTGLFGGGSLLIKLVVDTILFFLSFRIQRDWVFRSDKQQP